MIKAIYKTGSALFMPNPNDIDYVYIYEIEDERREALKHHNPHKEEGKDIHLSSVERQQRLFLQSYQLHYMELVEGEAIEPIDIFNEEYKTKLIEMIRGAMGWLPIKSKLWYHIYIIKCLFEKGKYYKFTKAEKGVFQKIHDEGVDTSLKNDLINYFDNL